MADEIRVGMIGCDTSHCGAFTGMFNDPQAKGHTPGFQVVACYPSFSPDLESSASRVDGYKKMLSEKYGVKMTRSIEEMLEQVDVVLLESVDGRRHLQELKPVAKAGKPVYIDKPFAASVADAREMVKLIKDKDLPAFGCSSLRYDSAVQKFVADESHGKVLGCDAFGPAHLEKTNPGLFWYGVHGVEILYTIMGRGCQTVQCLSTPDGDLATGVWSDGRLGTMRGIRKGRSAFGATVLCEKSPPQRVASAGDFYAGLVATIAEFFKTRKPPFPIDDTLEICAYMDAAWRSSEKNGDEVELAV